MHSQADKLSCQNFMDADIKQESPNSETKSMMIHDTCHFFFPSKPHKVAWRGLDGCYTYHGFISWLRTTERQKLEFRTICCKQTCLIFVLEEDMIFISGEKTNQLFSREGTQYLLSSVQLLSHVRLFAIPWTATCQASLSITNFQACSNSCPWSR